jgi:hypothetical protein
VILTLTPRMAAMLASVAATTGIASRTEVLRRAVALFVYLHDHAATHDIVLRDRATGKEDLISLATRAELISTSPAAVQAATGTSKRDAFTSRDTTARP